MRVLLFRLLAPVIGIFARRGSLDVSYRGLATAHFGDGSGPRYRIKVESLRLFPRVLRSPDLGCGETFVDGQWSTETAELAGLLGMFLRNYRSATALPFGRLVRRSADLAPARSIDRSKSRRNAAHHYDIGNDLYEAFLDSGMNYSCAFFERRDQPLREAQLNKLRTTAHRLAVADGMRVLDIGCGWGEMSRILANETDAGRVDGITLAENQLSLARERARVLNRAPPRYLLADYRDHADRNPGAYDRIVSIGMFEHVGCRHLVEYFDAVRRLLRDDGLALVHSIMRPTRSRTGAWIEKYIFPGGYIPTVDESLQSARAAGLEPAHPPFDYDGFHYAETLRHWRHNFERAWPGLDRRRYDERFRRIWTYYLCGSEAAFAEGGMFVSQILLKKAG